MNRQADKPIYIFLVFIRGGGGTGSAATFFGTRWWKSCFIIIFYPAQSSAPFQPSYSIKTINMKLQKHDALQDDMTFSEAYFSKNIRKSTDP